MIEWNRLSTPCATCPKYPCQQTAQQLLFWPDSREIKERLSENRLIFLFKKKDKTFNYLAILPYRNRWCHADCNQLTVAVFSIPQFYPHSNVLSISSTEIGANEFIPWKNFQMKSIFSFFFEQKKCEMKEKPKNHNK